MYTKCERWRWGCLFIIAEGNFHEIHLHGLFRCCKVRISAVPDTANSDRKFRDQAPFQENNGLCQFILGTTPSLKANEWILDVHTTWRTAKQIKVWVDQFPRYFSVFFAEVARIWIWIPSDCAASREERGLVESAADALALPFLLSFENLQAGNDTDPI